ncbi:MAG: hypothetical protein WAW88_00595 [Nocardioides sp.]
MDKLLDLAPTDQAALAGVLLGAALALLGVFGRALIDVAIQRRQLDSQKEALERQLASQRDMLTAQLDAQRAIAAEAAAEERARALLVERRERYAVVLEQSQELSTHLGIAGDYWTVLKRDHPTFDEHKTPRTVTTKGFLGEFTSQAPGWREYDKVREAVEAAVVAVKKIHDGCTALELIAPSRSVAAVVQLRSAAYAPWWASSWDTDRYRVAVEGLLKARNVLLEAARRDLTGSL